MKSILKIAFVVVASILMVSCFDQSKPNYQYMPNMYEPVGYETYGDYSIFPNNQEAMLPVEGTIARGWMPYDYDNSNEGLALAKTDLKNTMPVTVENLEKGKELYDVYCAVCHGKKGDGKGILVEREKILGVPSYDDAGRVITEGGVYHVMMYGLNSMGSYASQTSEEERWQITHHVMNLKRALKGEPLVTPDSKADLQNEVNAESNGLATQNVNVEETSSEEEH